MNAIASKYAAEQKEIEDEGQEMGDHPDGHHVSGTIKFKRQDFSFDLPSVTMRPKTMSLDLPQVTMRNKKVSWDNPVVVMRNKVVGRYPTTTCNWHGCTVKWRDIIIKVPTTEMRRQEIVTAIPEFRMDRTSFVTSVPVIKMNRQNWSAVLPQITVDSPIPTNGPTDQEDEATALRSKADALTAKINQDVADSTAALFDCYRTDLTNKRTTVAAQFEGAIKQLSSAIDATTAAGADPTNIVSEDGKVDLVAQRKTLLAERDTTLAKIDEALARLGTSQDRTLDLAVDPVEETAASPPADTAGSPAT